MEQTVISDASSGENVFRFTTDDGENATLIVRNGERGERGYPGNVHIGSDPPPPGAVIWLNPDGTPDGVVVPAGGKTGQILRKRSNADFDVEWGDLGIEIASNEEVSDMINAVFGAGSAGNHEVVSDQEVSAMVENVFAGNESEGDTTVEESPPVGEAPDGYDIAADQEVADMLKDIFG